MDPTEQVSPADIALPPSPPLPPDFGDLHDHTPITPTFPTMSSPQRYVPQRASSPDNSPSTFNMPSHPFQRPRAHSPMSRGQIPRSHSTNAAHPLPPMQRAHSSPGFDSTGQFIVPPATTRRPASPLGPPGRRRSPLRSAMEESYPTGPTWSGLYIEPNIPEHAELDIPTSYSLPYTSMSDADSPLVSSPAYNTLPRSRRGPSSPLYQSASSPNLTRPTITPVSTGNSPLLVAHRYANEVHPLHHAASFGSGSSMPSTPTSFRSRSPSISSLETIPDSPDAEEAALLEDEESVRERGSRAEGDDEGKESKRRSPSEMRFGSKDKRKRWSVCGAERRGDFSLEVIEE